MSENNQKKYWVIVKVSPKRIVENGKEKDHCCKWRVTNLLSFTRFLDRKHPDWCWYNVYEYTKAGNGNQIGCFTKNKRPVEKYI